MAVPSLGCVVSTVSVLVSALFASGLLLAALTMALFSFMLGFGVFGATSVASTSLSMLLLFPAVLYGWLHHLSSLLLLLHHFSNNCRFILRSLFRILNDQVILITLLSIVVFTLSELRNKLTILFSLFRLSTHFRLRSHSFTMLRQ